MRDPFIAVDTATNLRSHARRLRRSWDATRGGGRPDGDVRPLVEASWRRTARAGLDPEVPAPLVGFAADELEDRRDASGLRPCVDVLRSCLGAWANDAEHVMVVADAACRILWLEGDLRVRRRADRITFAEGMDWTEESVGTNAIGTAGAIDHAVQIFSAEHFAAKQHPWWCSAAPIHDPTTGALLGVVDLSGPMHTAHPHSLALVSAAAAMAQEHLRSRRALEDERLRRRYLERTLGSGRRPHALVAGDGRVLEAEADGEVSVRLDVPPDGGPVALPGGGSAVAEPLPGGEGFVLWSTAPGGARTPPTLRLELLGRAPTVRVGRADPLALGARHAEILCLLTLHPEGLTGEALRDLLHGEGASAVTVRAEVSRLRRTLGDVVAARPYRLAAPVRADVLDVRAALLRHDVPAALDAYAGRLLPDATAPGVVRAREALHADVRRAVLQGDLDRAWEFLGRRAGRDDVATLRAVVRRASPSDARGAVAEARLVGLGAD